MLKKLSEPLQKFFGFLGASIGSITAIFTAAGFLAERARLTMLGLPSTTFDLQQYLETGARFLAFLPLYLGMAFYYTVLGLLSALVYGVWQQPLVVGALLVLAGGVLWWWRRRRQDATTQASELPGRLVAFVRRHPVALLVGFLLVQFLGAYQLTQALEISNLLFVPTTTGADSIPHAELSIISTETLKNWVLAGDAARASQFLGWLFLITLLTAWGLDYMRRLYRASDRTNPSFWQLTAFAASLLLFITQVTLLPINYGILLSSNRFAEVSVVYAGEGVQPTEAPLYLLHETGNGYYFYTRGERTVWFVQRGDVQTILHHRMARVLQPRAALPGAAQP